MSSPKRQFLAYIPLTLLIVHCPLVWVSPCPLLWLASEYINWLVLNVLYACICLYHLLYIRYKTEKSENYKAKIYYWQTMSFLTLQND